MVVKEFSHSVMPDVAYFFEFFETEFIVLVADARFYKEVAQPAAFKGAVVYYGVQGLCYEVCLWSGTWQAGK